MLSSVHTNFNLCMENKEKPSTPAASGRKISKEEMDKYDKKLSDMSIEILKMPISVVKAFADYLINAVNFSSWVADLQSKGLMYDVISKEEYEAKYAKKNEDNTDN